MRSHASRFQILRRAPSALLGVLAAGPAFAQQPTPQQVQQGLQQAQQSPAAGQQLRDRLRASGMSNDQIRSRLQQMGYAPGLLDSFLTDSSEAGRAGAPSDEMLKALAALGVSPGPIQGLSTIPVDTGAQRGTGILMASPIFGADVFRSATTQFQPQLAGPVPASYRMGPGDVMVLVLTGDVESVHTLEVTREGFVVVPQVGQLYVNSLTLDQLRQTLRDRLGRSYSGIRTGTTRFDVTIARLRTNQITVVGEVSRPGAYQLASVGTVLNALYAAGGPTDQGNFRQIEVRRQGNRVAAFDLYEYLLRGDTRNDVVLEQGDVVFVPVHGNRAHVTGAVTRPAIYEIKSTENLASLLAAAGGFRSDAALSRVSVHRILGAADRAAGTPVRTVIDVRLTPQAGDTTQLRAAVSIPPFPILDGDSVVIDAVPVRGGRNFVDIQGNVYLPGRYGIVAGMTLSQLLRVAGGLRPATYAGRAHIERLEPRDSTRFVVATVLPAAENGAWPDDPVLHEYDIVTIYGREEFRENRTVRVAGMVNRPGVYQYRNGMTLRDIILMARGLADGAFLDTVEIDRLPADRTGGRLSVTLRVPMDSTYLFERDSTSYRFLPGMPARSRGAPEVPLDPFDQILIWKQREFELQRNVDVVGEVHFPATYALQTKSDRLSDVIKRAGGLLPTAYPQGARFIRSFGGAGRVSLDLAQALREPGSRNDPILQPGDSIMIPEYIPTVRVEGGVNTPTSVLYRQGASLSYYIDNAGGYSRTADKNRVSVRYADGSAKVKHKFLLFTTSPDPGPGSLVVVPTAPEGQPFDITGFLGNLAQVAASVVAIAVVATRL